MARYYVWEILKELEDVSGSNAKLAILQREKNNTELQTFINLALNPHIQFYIRAIPEFETSNIYQGTLSLSRAMKKLSKLSERAYTGNAAKDYLAKILASVEEENQTVIERIISKDLKCGVAEGTVNKVWPGLIPSFPCMLCQSFSEKNLANIIYPAIIQEKCDGMRCAAIFDGKKIDYRSRNGKALDILGALDEELIEFSHGVQYVFDGELLVVDHKGKILPRKKGNGILNKASKGTITPEEASRIRFVVWDIIPLNEWKKGKYEVYGYSNRYEYLRNRIRKLGLKKVSVPETEIVNNHSQAKDFYKRMLESGREGAVLKNMDSIWEDTRSKNQCKMKVECEVELIIREVNEGKGRLKGKVGALVCESSDGKLSVKVGSGFSDSQRKEFWEEDIIGKIVTVKGNEVISSDGRDTKALFLPVFIEIREDKNEAETLAEIEEKFKNA